MERIFQIQNLKSDGSLTYIIKNMIDIHGVKKVALSIPRNELTIDVNTATVFEKVRQKLSQLGYPVVGERNSLIKKATSYISRIIK